MLKIVKWIALSLFLVSLLLSILYWDLVVYGIRQGKGQLNIVWNAKPVEDFLNDPAFPDSLKAKLQLIEEVRKFAIDSLGLKDTKNYRTLYDQKGEEIMWVVTASEPFQLTAKEWVFPVLGAMPYKGFFNRNLALAEQQQLDGEGWDVSVRNPGGWSTLGWFTDPILSGMLERSDGDLASLIIHELVHSTIFVKDSADLNENLASFIGDRGAEKFLMTRFGASSIEYTEYLQEEKDFIAYVDHILRGCTYLDGLYSTLAELPIEEKLRRKEEAIQRIMTAADTLSLKTLQNPAQRRLDQLPNNAYFMSFRRYQSRQDDFWREWQKDFSGNLCTYIAELAKRYPYL